MKLALPAPEPAPSLTVVCAAVAGHLAEVAQVEEAGEAAGVASQLSDQPGHGHHGQQQRQPERHQTGPVDGEHAGPVGVLTHQRSHRDRQERHGELQAHLTPSRKGDVRIAASREGDVRTAVVASPSNKTPTKGDFLHMLILGRFYLQVLWGGRQAEEACCSVSPDRGADTVRVLQIGSIPHRGAGPVCVRRVGAIVLGKAADVEHAVTLLISRYERHWQIQSSRLRAVRFRWQGGGAKIFSV